MRNRLIQSCRSACSHISKDMCVFIKNRITVFVRIRHEYLSNGFLGVFLNVLRKISSRSKYRYRNWIYANRPKANDLAKQKEDSLRLKYYPLISIIVPTYNTDETMLSEMIDSVTRQTYLRWELCIADGGSESPYVFSTIKMRAQKDQRIKYVFLGENRGISGNTNAALKLAGGEYIALLDHDDMLAEHALFSMVRAINQYPNAGVLYSDEDKFSKTKNGSPTDRYGPHFKPGWNPELLHSCNYISHLLVMKREIVREIGGFRSAFDGSQDYDIILRITEKTREIVHIPDVLYHWRVHAKSTSGSSGAKTWAFDAGVQAVQDSFERNGINAVISTKSKYPGHHTVDIQLLGSPCVSIIVVNYDGSLCSVECIDSIVSNTRYENIEIIVIADIKTMLPDSFKKLKNIFILNQKDNQKFSDSERINLAARTAKGEYLLLVDSSTQIIIPRWIEMLLQYSQNNNTGCTGARIVDTKDRIVFGELILGLNGTVSSADAGLLDSEPGYMCRAQDIQNVSVVSHICFMIKKELFDRHNGMNEQLSIPCATIDLCLWLLDDKKENIYNPLVKLSMNNANGKTLTLTKAEYEYLLEKWGKYIVSDPYYNPNFSVMTSAGFRVTNKASNKSARIFIKR